MGNPSGENWSIPPTGATLAAPLAAALPVLSRPDARVGLFGGMFDPVHLGHLAVAHAAMRELHLDHLFFIPAAQAPLRGVAPGTSVANRLDLLHRGLAADGDPRLDVLDLEARENTVQYTVDTVRQLRAAWPEAQLFWLLGADQFAQLDKWREPQELARMVEFAVLDRPGHPPPAPPPELAPVLRWIRLEGSVHPASATEIRRRRRAEEPWEFWLPPAVAHAIEERKLYG